MLGQDGGRLSVFDGPKLRLQGRGEGLELALQLAGGSCSYRPGFSMGLRAFELVGRVTW